MELQDKRLPGPMFALQIAALEREKTPPHALRQRQTASAQADQRITAWHRKTRKKDTGTPRK
jgi:hypothetical protein